ncbi:MAG TPA: hypothetical protein VN577_20000 [Terriglobales bacterium]|nr:hypothetical protein [Terriglobales bacterium]
MAKTIDDFQKRLSTLIQDPSGKLPDEDRRAIIAKAIVQVFSKDRPHVKVVEILGNGTNDIALPGEFVDGFSLVSKVEYPIGNIPATYIDDADYGLYRTPTGLKLRFMSAAPADGEKIWSTFTAPHKDDGSTIADVDFEAVCDCAAAIALEVLATKYGGTVDPQISADVVNWRSKSQEYLALAKAAWQRYYKALGIQAGGSSEGAGQSAAVAVGEMETGLSFGGDRLTHQRRR